MGRRKNIQEPGFFNTPEDPPVEKGPPPPRSADEIIRAAQKGDRSVVPELRQLLAKNPEIMGGNGDIAMATRMYWLGAITGKDFFRFECLNYQAEHLTRRLLAETNGTVVEEMLVDLVVNEWLQMAYHQQKVAFGGRIGIEVLEFTLKKLTASFHRYTKSLGALTTLRQVKFTQAMKQAMVEIAGLRYDQRARPPADDGSDSKSAA